MNPIISPNARRLIPIPGAQVTKNAFGLDVLQRPFSCPLANVGSLLPGRGSPDRVWRSLTHTGQFTIVETEGTMCIVTVEYKGLISNALPPPLVSGGMASGQASATNDKGKKSDQRTWEMVFQSPLTTYRYISREIVRSPRYGFVGTPSPKIIMQTIRDGEGYRRSGASGISQTVRAELAALTSLPVAGTPFFENEETWRGVIVLTAN